MTRTRVAVLDYGSGNVHSAVKALAHAGAEVELTGETSTLMQADGVFVPGVGAYDEVMSRIIAARADELIDRRLAGGLAVFGVCVGHQVLFQQGIERGVTTEGLGQWPGTVRQLQAPILPHLGWSKVATAPSSTLFTGIEDEYFYFLHSNAATEWTIEGRTESTRPLVSWSEHGERFIAAVENGPLSATQFHPEKSGEAGIQLLQNWIQSLT